MLMDDPQAIDALRDRITAFAPSHVAMPALGDAHPDHSALHVMAELALLQAGSRCVRLAYCVHGASSPDASPMDPPRTPSIAGWLTSKIGGFRSMTSCAATP